MHDASILEPGHERTFTGSVLKPIFFLLLSLFCVPLRAFVVGQVWTWFVVPFWPGLAISKWAIYGISMIVSWASAKPPEFNKPETSTSEYVRGFIHSFVSPVVSLFYAWIIKIVFLRGVA